MKAAEKTPVELQHWLVKPTADYGHNNNYIIIIKIIKAIYKAQDRLMATSALCRQRKCLVYCRNGKVFSCLLQELIMDEIPERDVTYHLTCLLIYHGTTTHL